MLAHYLKPQVKVNKFLYVANFRGAFYNQLPYSNSQNCMVLYSSLLFRLNFRKSAYHSTHSQWEDIPCKTLFDQKKP